MPPLGAASGPTISTSPNRSNGLPKVGSPPHNPTATASSDLNAPIEGHAHSKDSARDLPGALPTTSSNAANDENALDSPPAPPPPRRNTLTASAMAAAVAAASSGTPTRGRGLSIAMSPLPLGSLIGGNGMGTTILDEKNTTTASTVVVSRDTSTALDKEIASYEREDAKRGVDGRLNPFPSITIATDANAEGRDENKGALFSPSASSPNVPTRTPSPRAAGSATTTTTPPAANRNLKPPGANDAEAKRAAAKKAKRASRGGQDDDDEETGLALLTSRAIARADAERHERDSLMERAERMPRTRSPATADRTGGGSSHLRKPSDLIVPLAGSAAPSPGGTTTEEGERGRALRHKVFDLMAAFDDRMRDMRHLWVELCGATGFVSEQNGPPLNLHGLGMPRFGSHGGNGLPSATSLGAAAAAAGGLPSSPAVARKLAQSRGRRDSLEASGLHALVEARAGAAAPSTASSGLISALASGGGHARRHSVRLQPLPPPSVSSSARGGAPSGALWGAVADQMDLELPLKTPRQHLKQKSSGGGSGQFSGKLARQHSSNDKPKGPHLSVPGGGSPASPTHKISGGGPVVPPSPGGPVQGPAATPVSAISIPAPPILSPTPIVMVTTVTSSSTHATDTQASLISAATTSSVASIPISPQPTPTSVPLTSLDRETSGSGASALLLERKLLPRGESRRNILKNTAAAGSGSGTSRDDKKEGTPRDSAMATTPSTGAGGISNRHARRMTRTSIMTGGMMGDLALAGSLSPSNDAGSSIMASAIAANIGKDLIIDGPTINPNAAAAASSHATLTIRDSGEHNLTSPDPEPVDDPTMRQPLVSNNTDLHGRRPSQAARFFELQNNTEQIGGRQDSGRRGSRSIVGRRNLAGGSEGVTARRKSTPFADLKAVKQQDDENNTNKEGGNNDGTGDTTIVPADNGRDMRDINEEEEDSSHENDQAARSFGRFFNSIQPQQLGDRYRADDEGHEHRHKERCTRFFSGMAHVCFVLLTILLVSFAHFIVSLFGWCEIGQSIGIPSIPSTCTITYIMVSRRIIIIIVFCDSITFTYGICNKSTTRWIVCINTRIRIGMDY
jgi:hypothetical protein